jgi:hypothetical protein
MIMIGEDESERRRPDLQSPTVALYRYISVLPYYNINSKRINDNTASIYGRCVALRLQKHTSTLIIAQETNQPVSESIAVIHSVSFNIITFIFIIIFIIIITVVSRTKYGFIVVHLE